MAFDIYDFVFYNLLKYDYSSSVLTGDLQHDVIFGLLIPTVFIAFVLYFSVRNVFGAGHPMIGNLAAITGLGVIITLGWVPLIAGFGSFVFVALLALLFIGAFYRRLVPDGAEMKLRSGATKLGGMVDIGNPVIPKKQRRALGVRLHSCQAEYKAAKEAIEAFRTKDGGNKIVMGDSNTENATEIQRHTKMSNHAVEKAVQILEYFPISERSKVLKDYTDYAKFQEAVTKFFDEVNVSSLGKSS